MSFKKVITEISNEVDSFTNDRCLDRHVERKFKITLHNFQANIDDNIHYLTCRNSYTVLKALKKNAKAKKEKKND